jgi:protein-S-isoprenylcysteine O-methyltransferase Ste14
VCPAAPPSSIGIGPFYLFAASLSIAGAILRLACYRTLGPLFTFNLSMHPDHTLVTSGPYSVVRHPSYLGSLMLNFGLGMTFFARASGSALVACGWTAGAPASIGPTTFVLAYWSYYLAVGRSRCKAEDVQLRTSFGMTWEAYAERVRWWYLPGIY